MLAIRMKRTGRKGHAQYRVVVQDSRLSPSSGRVVAFLGSYNPHTKATILDKEKVSSFLVNGAHPSDRVAKLLKKEGVELPKWVKISSDKERAIKNPVKLRRNQPKEEKPVTPEEEVSPAAEPSEEPDTETEVAEDTPGAEVEEQSEAVVDSPESDTDTPSEAEKPLSQDKPAS